MPAVPYIVQKREQRRRRARRPAGRAGLAALGLAGLAAVSMAGLLLVVAASLGYAVLIAGLPSLETLPALLEPPNGALLQPTRLYDRTGEHLLLALENPAAAGRQYLKVPADTAASPGQALAPSVLISATLAVSDPDFWEHAGFSISGLFREEKPTLAQRLASEILLWDEPSSRARSLRVRLIAAQLTASYGREKVLEWYLNSARYGEYIYGADAAARVYFGKPATDLTLAEAAVIAAAAETPDLNPFSAPQSALEGGQAVLNTMLAQEMVTYGQARQAMLEKVKIQAQPDPLPELTPAFTRLALDQLAMRFNRERLERGGLVILTTLDYDLQTQAACAAQTQLERMQSIPDTPIQPGTCPAARLLPTQPFSAAVPDLPLTSSALVVDPATGYLHALVGSTTPGLDPTRPPGKPPGTLVTPFIYLTAFTRGFTPSTLLWDIPDRLPEDLTQQVALSAYRGPIRLRSAFANDYLIPAIQVLGQVGPENVWRTAQQMGLESLTQAAVSGYLQSVPLLSGGEVTLLEAARAYGVLANQGLLAGGLAPAASNQALQGSAARMVMPGQPPPLHTITVLKVTDTEGRTWLDCAASVNCSVQSRPVVSPQLAYLTTHILSDETARWESLGHPNPLEVGRPAAAKIGKTSGKGGVWVVGYTNQLVAGIWTGPELSDSPEIEFEPDEEKALVNGTAALWHAVVKYASRDLPAQNWPVPAGLVRLEVCDPSGLLPTSTCPILVPEVFMEGTEPSHPDNLFRVFQINRETGRLATIFTPPGLVEEKIFLVAPPEALEWVSQAGLPVPPGDYDVVYTPAQSSQTAAISYPLMFSHVSGKLLIKGSAGGDGFSFYRIQVGKGLNPREWLQIGEDVSNPVRDKVLGEWDTSGLSGLYAIRMMIVNQEQRVETVIVQVTVDNTPPQVAVEQPVEDQSFSLRESQVLVFKALAADDVSLDKVEFYLDDILLASMAEAPFNLAWEGSKGRHLLRVAAYDLGGNSSDVLVEFEVVN